MKKTGQDSHQPKEKLAEAPSSGQRSRQQVSFMQWRRPAMAPVRTLAPAWEAPGKTGIGAWPQRGRILPVPGKGDGGDASGENRKGSYLKR